MCRNHENNSIMAHGLHAMIKSEIGCNSSSTGKPRVEQQIHQQRPGGSSSSSGGTAGKMGSRRIFTPQFKLQVLDSYRNDGDCKGNQRATARKYGIHRRQIQKWLQVENNLRSAAANSASNGGASAMKINLISNSGNAHHHHHHHHHNPQQAQPQFQLHPLHHHHIHQQNLNSIELKVPLDSTRHRVAQNASSANNNNNNNTILINGNSKESSACIISPVSTHTATPSPFSHPHHESSSSSASLSVLKAHSREATATTVASQMPRPNFPPVSGDFPIAPTPTHPAYDRLLEPYYRYPYGSFALDCPIDLSLPAAVQQQYQLRKVEQALSPCSTVSSVYSSRPRSSTPFPAEIKREDSPRHELVEEASSSYEAVDLSCRKRKASSCSSATDDAADGPSPPKSVKLFKPYLLDEKSADDKDDKDSSIDSPVAVDSLRDAADPSGRLDYPIIWNFHAQQRYYESLYEFGRGAGGPFNYPPSPPYLPLTPIPRTPFSTLSPSPPSSSSQWAQPQASPVSGYDSSTSISSVYSNDGNDDGYSYSLELKQQAIDSFYHDVSCRGDFRAVASKYNINRKYVEKWLAQEDYHHVAVTASQSGGSQVPPPPLPQVVVG